MTDALPSPETVVVVSAFALIYMLVLLRKTMQGKFDLYDFLMLSMVAIIPAGFTLFPEDSSVLTVEYKLNLLAPAQGERIVAEGFVVKPGRTLAITRGEVHAEQGGQRTLVAIMQQTLMVMRDTSDARRDRREASGAAAAPGASTGAADD